MAPEDVGDALRNMVDALAPGGVVLDLQVVRPDPVIELDGELVCVVDGEPLCSSADAAAAAIDALVAAGELVEKAVGDHEVRQQWTNGRELVAEFATEERSLPGEAIPRLLAIERPLVMRERCRLRRLRRASVQVG